MSGWESPADRAGTCPSELPTMSGHPGATQGQQGSVFPLATHLTGTKVSGHGSRSAAKDC